MHNLLTVADAFADGAFRSRPEVNSAFRVLARFVGTTLVGVGIGGIVAFWAEPALVLAVGGLMVAVGGLVVSVTVMATLLIPLWSRQTSSAAQVSLLTPGLFGAITIGLLGAGIAAGSQLTVAWPSVIAGAAGVAALLLTGDPAVE